MMIVQKRVSGLFVGCLSMSLMACGEAGPAPGSEEADTVGTVQEQATLGVSGYAVVNANGTIASWGSTDRSVPVTVTHSGAGAYTVAFPKLGGGSLNQGNVQVVAHGAGNARCKVALWGGTAPGAESVLVLCHTPTGAVVDAGFGVRYLRNNGQTLGAYLYANQPTATAEYSVDPTYSFNSHGGANRAFLTKTTGVYQVTLPGFGGGGGHVEVTAYGTSPGYCSVAGWGLGGMSGADQIITVACFDKSGKGANTAFSLDYDDDHQVGLAGVGGYLWANDATSSSYVPATAYSYYYGIDTACRSGTLTNVGHTAKGSYYAVYPYQYPTGGSAHVSAYGFGNAYCKVSGIKAYGASSVEVDTHCYDPAGNAIDAQYVEDYTTNFNTLCL